MLSTKQLSAYPMLLDGILKLVVKKGQSIYLKEIIPLTWLKVKIQCLTIDCSTNTITINTAPTGITTIIPHFMSIDKLMVHITAVLDDSESSVVIYMNGYWKIGAASLKVMLTYTSAEGHTSVKITPVGKTSIKDFIKSFTGLSLPINPTIHLGFSFEGCIAEDGYTTLTLTSDAGANKYYAIYQNEGTDPPYSVRSIALEITNFNLRSVLKKLIHLDIASVPLFGKLNVKDLGIIYADGDTELSHNIFSKSKLLQMSENTITKGLTAYITVPFHNEPLIAKYKNNTLILTTPNQNLKLNSIIHFLVKGITTSKLKLPSAFTNIFKMVIETITITSHNVLVSVVYPHDISFFNGFIGLSHAKITN